MLNPNNGRIFKCYTYPHSSGDGAAYIEVWEFKQNIDINDIILQEDETCNAKWASKKEIKEMIHNGIFINFNFIDDLFAYH